MKYETKIPRIRIVRDKICIFKKMSLEKLNTPTLVYKHLIDYYEDSISVYESFIAIYFNTNLESIAWLKLSNGGMVRTVVDVKMLIKGALDVGATGIIISHNHPSGNINASDADIRLTKKINKACKIFDITLIDHIIVTEHSYYSFGDNDKI